MKTFLCTGRHACVRICVCARVVVTSKPVKIEKLTFVTAGMSGPCPPLCPRKRFRVA